MSTCSISAICVTYGRTAQLQEAIAAFEAQDIKSPVELLILNTFGGQKLSLGWNSQVRIINLPIRLNSLGESRNRAIAESNGDVIVIVDDDDIPLKGHLRFYAEAFAANPDCDWILNDAQFYMEGDQIKAISPGAKHMFAYTKRAWKAVGGYPDLTCGEDRALVKAITERFKGKRIVPEIPTFIYRWGQGTYHASGLGDDKPGETTAHERIARDLAERIRKGQEPAGDILLKPELKMDYEKVAADFIKAQKARAPKKGSVCIVMLGRLGDIVNVLPIAKDFHDEGITPHLMVSWEFKSILEGVSYVHPLPVWLPFEEVNDAIQIARANFERVIQCQIFGRNYIQTHLTPTFNQESWRMAGYSKCFRDRALPLVFDRRDPERERVLCERAFRTDKPKIVTNLTSAVSAPFPHGQELLEQLHHALPQFEFVEAGGYREKTDLGSLRCLYPFDVLGIMDKAVVIVTIDTLTLHLALATKVPMVCIVRDGWEGAEPRWGCAAKFTYSEAGKDPGLVVKAVMTAVLP